MGMRLDQIPAPPQRLEELPAYLNQLHEVLLQLFQFIEDSLFAKTQVVPSKLEEGMVRYADGVNWNPGAGEGLYHYDGTAWNKL